jgi:hypothetical protein
MSAGKLRLRAWLPYILIACSGFILYAKTLNFDFVDYDDRHLIVSNQKFISDIGNIPQAFFRDVFDVEFFRSSKSYYRPLLTASLIIDAQAGGTSPAVYHFTNILYHVTASCLLLLLLRRLGYEQWPAAIMSLIFTVHPLLSQAVAWIPGRNDSLLAVFVLLSFISFIRLIETDSIKYYLLHMAALLAALFTKETALGLIAVSALYALIFMKARIKTWKGILVAAGWTAAVLLWLILRSSAIKNTSVTLTHILKSIFLNSPGLIQYFGKIFLPVNLTVYPIMQDISLIYGIAALILVSIAVFFSGHKNMRMVLFGGVWFLVFILPSLISAEPGANSMFLEHRAYVPMMGIVILIMETDVIKKIRAGFSITAVILLLTAGLFGYISFSHSDAMKDSFSYWSDAVAGSPHSAVARINLGDRYYALRRLDLAEKEFRKAIELDPARPLAHNNLGRIFAVKGMFKEAEQEFRKELEIDPDSDKALYNLGTLNYDLGRIESAVDYWQKAVQVNPYNINANRFLAVYYYRKGMHREADRYIERLNEMGINLFNRRKS